LYLRGLLRGVFEGPAADWTIRQRLETLESSEGPGTLHHRLLQIDPVSARRLHPNDRRRIIRALEVFEILGQPLSTLQRNGPRPETERPKRVFWLSPPREWLYRRIDVRVSQMMKDGLVDEVTNLLARPEPLGSTARQGLGYKEVIDWLEANQTRDEHDIDRPSDCAAKLTSQSMQALIMLIQTRTRQFAKRQHTWFRNLEECHPVPIDGTESAEQIADSLVGMIRD
jgi:tRNA dimethylallyltransferase